MEYKKEYTNTRMAPLTGYSEAIRKLTCRQV
jgi:hypothetical protein